MKDGANMDQQWIPNQAKIKNKKKSKENEIKTMLTFDIEQVK